MIQGNIILEDDLVVFGRIIGDITSKGTIEVHGSVEGNMIGKSVRFHKAKIQGDIMSEEAIEISEGSIVNGNITTDYLMSNGYLSGDAKVMHIASLKRCARMKGDIEASEIEIERGALISGNVVIKKS